MKCSLGVLNFLEMIYSFSCSLVFHFFFFFFCIDHWGILSYLSLLVFGVLDSNGNLFPFFPLTLLSLLFSAICKASSDNHFAFLHLFSWGWPWRWSKNCFWVFECLLQIYRSTVACFRGRGSGCITPESHSMWHKPCLRRSPLILP